MNKLIKNIANKLQNASYWTESTSNEDNSFDNGNKVIELQTAIDIVYNEVKAYKTKWINTAPKSRSDNIVCAECGYNSIAKYPYCPNCGRQMREDVEAKTYS